MTILNVTYHIKSGMRDAFVAAISEKQIAAHCHLEPGCLEYAFSLPVDEAETDTVFLRETYTDDEAFAFHKLQPHFAVLQELKGMFVEATDIRISHA